MDWSAPGVGDGGVETGEEFGFAGKRLGAELGAFWAIKVQFVAVDDEGDPADHASDYGGEIAELHGARVRLEVDVALGEAVDGFASGGGFTVELGEEVVL